jgi:TPR repeat protein
MTLISRARSRVLILAPAAVAALAAGCSQASRLDAKCVAGDVQACSQLGDMYADGRGVPRNLARAGQSYERACDLGAPDICNTLGEIVEVTGDVDGGSRRAEQLFQKACQGGSSPGCLNLGLAAAAREELALAASLYEKSCDGGWAAGCHQLGLSYQEGQGVAKDDAKAIDLFVHGCDGEFVESCLLLGNLYAAGELVPKDNVQALTFYAKALKVYQDSCTVGNERDCTERDRVRTRMAVVSSGQAPTPNAGVAVPASPIK